MTRQRPLRAWLVAVGLVTGCTATTPEPGQIVTGRLARSHGAVAVRAVSDQAVITAARVRIDGSFTLQLPTGNHYRLELLTSHGIKHVVAGSGHALHQIAFEVCHAGTPYDLGTLGTPVMGDCPDPTNPDCSEMCTDPDDPTCGKPMCPDPTNPECPPKCEPGDPTCTQPMCPDPTNPECPPKCEPGDPNCGDPMCTDPTDPACNPCGPDGKDCGMCTDPMDPSCLPPVCDDPMDPTTCPEPCMTDPKSCGCPMGSDDCWGDPGQGCDADGTCMPNTGMTPQHAPSDFGCQEPVPS